MAMHAGTQVATPVILHCQDFTVPLMLLVSCRVHNTQKKNELEKLEKQLKIADQKLSSEGRQLDTLEHKVERLDNMREVCSSCPASLSRRACDGFYYQKK